MKKMQYAKEVARLVEGEVREVEKANGALYTGIMVDTGSNLKPTIYIDGMFEDGLSVQDAAAKVMAIVTSNAQPKVNIDFIMDYETVRPMLRARLYNKATKTDVYREAGHGFDDLIIIPYIEGVIENGACKVTSMMLDKWNMTADEVIDDAIRNSDKEASIKSMFEVMKELGYPMPDDMEDDGKMLIVSNNSKMFGAYAVISKLPILKVLFPNGFTVLPSSVHEVIVTPLQDQDTFDTMVQEVNDAEVDFTEQLSNHAYMIAA